MPDAYLELLDAAIQHLEGLKNEGVKFVQVAPETLAALASPRRPVSRPAAPPILPRPVETALPVVPAIVSPPKTTPPPILMPSPTRVAPVTSKELPVSPTVAARILTRAEKDSGMAALRARALACQKCSHLASSRKNVVFGVGDIHSPLMFVGEAPGADEDEQAEPFVGKAGQLLTRIIQTMGFDRNSVYIANILKCRPDTPGQSAGNRKPTPEEMKTCLPYLLEQIDLIQPKVIVALGATAVEGLLGKTIGISKLRGTWQTFRNTPLMPTYHPAYLLRNQALSEKRRVWEDMLQVLEKLGAPISEKQRGFFLKA
jgi:DNA polymerase